MVLDNVFFLLFHVLMGQNRLIKLKCNLIFELSSKVVIKYFQRFQVFLGFVDVFINSRPDFAFLKTRIKK